MPEGLQESERGERSAHLTCKWDKSAPAYAIINRDVLDLCEAYFELRGHKGMAVYINGMDNEVCTVASIKQIVEER